MVQGIELAMCVCVCVCVCARARALRVTQLCLSLCHPMDYSPPGSSLHVLLQVGILEWVPVPSSRGIFLTHGSNLSLLHLRQILYCLIPQGSPQGAINIYQIWWNSDKNKEEKKYWRLWPKISSEEGAGKDAGNGELTWWGPEARYWEHATTRTAEAGSCIKGLLSEASFQNTIQKSFSFFSVLPICHPRILSLRWFHHSFHRENRNHLIELSQILDLTSTKWRASTTVSSFSAFLMEEILCLMSTNNSFTWLLAEIPPYL